MGTLFKTIAGVFVTVVLYHTLSKQKKEIALLLSLTASCMICISALGFLDPVIEFLKHLQMIWDLDLEMFEVLLKALGIGIVTEIAVFTCKDVGNEALGKGSQLLSTTAIAWLALPLFNELLMLIERILGGI
jgi:stage III sporulation protein AD